MAYLPHIYPVGAIFFITFRLADSIPQNIINEIKAHFYKGVSQIKKENKQITIQEQKIYKLRKKLFGKFDDQLDQKPYGECYMNNVEVARIIRDRIFEYQDQYYTIDAMSIMPNHVHVLVNTLIQIKGESEIGSTPNSYMQVSKWMQLIKGGSAFEINKHLNRNGTLWEGESYDHYVRINIEGEFERIKSYIMNNPLKAKLHSRFMSEPYYYIKED